MVKYSLNGYSFPVKAEVVGNHIQELIDKNGGAVTPQQVLKSAKPKRSKIHACFEWDDSTAAHKYRLKQAGDLIRSVRIIAESNDKKVDTRAFINIMRDAKGELTHNKMDQKNTAYVSVMTMTDNNPLKAYTLDRALIELSHFQKKYQSLTELEKLFEILDEIKAEATD